MIDLVNVKISEPNVTNMKYNGIEYKFTKEEVESVATILKFARDTKDPELYRLATIVAKAFNRPLFEITSEAQKKVKSDLEEISKKLQG